MIEFYKRRKKDQSLKKIKKFKVGSWIKVTDPSKKDIDYLVDNFELEKENLEDGLDDNEIPRIETSEEATYVFIKTINSLRTQLDTMLIAIGKNFILTLSKNDPAYLSKILENKLKFVTTQKLKSLITLLELNDVEFEQTTFQITKEVKRKKNLSVELGEKELKNLLEKEDLLNSLLSAYVSTQLVYSRLLKKLNFYEEDKDVLDDLIIESEERFNLCRQSLKTISNIREYYLILTSNKLNKIINILTVFTIFISIPAAISGIYGMNIALPIQDNPMAFTYIMAFIGLLWVLFLVYVKRNRMI